MQRYWSRSAILFLLLALLLGSLGPAGARAQCGGSRHDQHMGSYGQMGNGQMGRYGSQAPVQPDPNAGYVDPVQSPVYGYTVPPDSGSYDQTMGQGGMASGPSGHMGH